MCTPGRMIDMLGANSGEFITLGRVASLSFIGHKCKSAHLMPFLVALHGLNSMIQYIMNQISTTY